MACTADSCFRSVTVILAHHRQGLGLQAAVVIQQDSKVVVRISFRLVHAQAQPGQGELGHLASGGGSALCIGHHSDIAGRCHAAAAAQDGFGCRGGCCFRSICSHFTQVQVGRASRWACFRGRRIAVIRQYADSCGFDAAAAHIGLCGEFGFRSSLGHHDRNIQHVDAGAGDNIRVCCNVSVGVNVQVAGQVH